MHLSFNQILEEKKKEEYNLKELAHKKFLNWRREKRVYTSHAYYHYSACPPINQNQLTMVAQKIKKYFSKSSPLAGPIILQSEPNKFGCTNK